MIGFISQSERLSHAIQYWDEEKLAAVILNLAEAHKKILEAIEARDAPAAKRYLREHLDYMESVALEEIGANAGWKTKDQVRRK